MDSTVVVAAAEPALSMSNGSAGKACFKIYSHGYVSRHDCGLSELSTINYLFSCFRD